MSKPSAKVVWMRIYRGWAEEEARTAPLMGRPARARKANRARAGRPARARASLARSALLEYDGLRLTLAEWEARTGLNRGTIYHRLRRGWPAARALTAPVTRAPGPAARPRLRIEHGGLSLTLVEWSARTGIHYKTLYRRLRKGWPAGLVLTPQAPRPATLAR